MFFRFEELKYDCKRQLRVCELGAFAADGILDFYLRVTPAGNEPGKKSIRFVDLLIHEDAWNSGETTFHRFPLEPAGERTPFDSYGASLWKLHFDFRVMLAKETDDLEGLFYYHYAVGTDDGETLILGGEAPVELSLLENFEGERQLLLYRPDFHTSSFFRDGLVYHIFVDRFFRSGKSPVKQDAVLDEDWDGGVPQYGEYPGAFVTNNVFFGGDLWGIVEKLPYIHSLGVRTIYLSPVFDAYSNHKYDTGDYLAVDEMFGGDEALFTLCREAGKLGIGVIFDGVFNHTGADSLYFNRYGRYPGVGAYQSEASPYAHWYHFRTFPEDYECWWGVKTLPRVNSAVQDYRRFIMGSVVKKWMDAGVSGWRLDVADELSDEFLDDFRRAVKGENPDAVVIGEVWEDASDKISYGKRRRYLGGGQLDAVMNYPLREGIIEYVKTGEGRSLRRATEGLYRRYPKEVSDNLLNFLSTHDTERILTVLGGEPAGDKTNKELSSLCMTKEKLTEGKRRLRLAYGILAGLPGVPSVFYGDEAGMEGYRDPFCRRPFPWRSADQELTEFFRTLGRLRREEPVFRDGGFRLLHLSENAFLYLRTPYEAGGKPILCAAVRKGSLILRFSADAECLPIGKSVRFARLTENETAYFRLPDETTSWSMENEGDERNDGSAWNGETQLF